MLGNETTLRWLWERKFLGAKVPRHFRSRERKFSGAKVPGSESSIYGTFVPGSESMWERKFHNSYILPHSVNYAAWKAQKKDWLKNTERLGKFVAESKDKLKGARESAYLRQVM